MKLQRASRLAIYAILELARDPDRQRASAEIAAAYGVSNHHLVKVLGVLAKAGLVEATRGASGGYRFVANPKRTTLHDLVSLFEPVGGDRAREPGETTPAGRALEGILTEIDDIATATLASVTVSTMCKLMA